MTKKPFSALPPSAHGQTAAQRLARLRTWTASGKATKKQLERYGIEIEELENAKTNQGLFDDVPRV